MQPTFEDDEKALRSGKGGMIAAMGGTVVLVLVGLGWMLLSGGGDETYRTLGKNVNGLDREYFDAFLGCTFSGFDLRRLTSDTEFRAQLDRRASSARERYGVKLRDECLPKLQGYRPKLDALISPEELRPNVKELGESVDRLRAAVSGYVAYLDQVEGPYDPDDAHDRVTAIARGWYDYRKAHKALNDALREKLLAD